MYMYVVLILLNLLNSNKENEKWKAKKSWKSEVKDDINCPILLRVVYVS